MKRLKTFNEHFFYSDDFKRLAEIYLKYKDGELSREDVDKFLMKKLNTPGESVLDKVELKAKEISDKLNKVNLDDLEDRVIMHFDKLLRWRQGIFKSLYYKVNNTTSRRYIDKNSDLIEIIFEELAYLMAVNVKKDINSNLGLIESAISMELNTEESELDNNLRHGRNTSYPIKMVEEIVEDIIEDAKLEIDFKRVDRDTADTKERKFSDDTLINNYELYFILK